LLEGWCKMTYIYIVDNSSPDLDTIQFTDVPASLMINQNILWCRWDQDIITLCIEWNGELSSEDKTILDIIVANNK